MREGFTRTEPDIWLKVVMVALLLACVLGLAYMLGQLQQRRARPKQPHPMALFRHVQSRLGLSWPDRWCLWWLTKVLSIDHPTALLISVHLYDQAVYRYCSSRGWIRNRAHAAPRLAAIRRRVFGPDDT